MCQSYFPLPWSIRERQERCREDYAFCCTCPRCQVGTCTLSCTRLCSRSLHGHGYAFCCTCPAARWALLHAILLQTSPLSEGPVAPLGCTLQCAEDWTASMELRPDCLPPSGSRRPASCTTLPHKIG